jgi:D-hexose-6-phosphate mutarotase
MSQIDQLNRRFGIAGQLDFETLPGGLAVARVSTDWATATVALQGAHLLTYRPDGQAPVIWLSDEAKFVPGKSIRGGVPVCWPWFGPHVDQPGFPGHGFARTVPWEMVQVGRLPDGRIRLEFELIHTDATRAQWPHACVVRNVITVGQELELELATTNTGEQSFTLGQALHTYFEVGDIGQVGIAGLEGCDFLDKVDGGARKCQRGDVAFTGETDRIYLGTRGCCQIRDPLLKRIILITSTGSRSTVVWNPWIDKSEKMGDFGSKGYRSMVCVETANAAEDVIVLGAGQTHRMAAQYRVLAA